LETLGRISDDAGQKIPIFLKALDDPSAEVRQPVIAGIGRLGKEAGPAADRLVDLLDSESDAKAALEALREIRPENLDLCLRLLKSDNVGGRLFACDRLGRLKDRRALPELRIAREEDEHRYVRRRAREAISRIERDKK
jgi:HEAT repeat protein